MSVHPLPERQDVYLQTYLEPLAEHLARPDVAEILVNRRSELWVEDAGGMTRPEAPAIDGRLVLRLAEQVARISNQAINREQPLLGAVLPNGARLAPGHAETIAYARWVIDIVVQLDRAAGQRGIADLVALAGGA